MELHCLEAYPIDFNITVRNQMHFEEVIQTVAMGRLSF